MVIRCPAVRCVSSTSVVGQDRSIPIGPGGRRIANWALGRIVILRIPRRRHRHYVVRRVEEGRSESEIIRCIERFAAREVFRAIVNPPDEIPIGADVRRARTDAGVTLTQLAIAIGLTPTNLPRLERASTRTPPVLDKHSIGSQRSANAPRCRGPVDR